MNATSFPAGPIQRCEGRAVVVPGDDIDTDRIIPARYLKCVTFDGLAEGVFADDRSERAGDHPFDRAENQGAAILVVNRNFGCGSSREHAPQALMRWGIRAVIGESFAEIFFGNCLALGIPCLSVDHEQVADLQAAIAREPAATLQLSLEDPQVRLVGGAVEHRWPLTLAEGPRRMLCSGEWNGTAQLVANDGGLRSTAERLPYLADFAAAAT
jgi:3-isopropylmalate/(R)-2-methylmalate dehydratase small subunit